MSWKLRLVLCLMSWVDVDIVVNMDVMSGSSWYVGGSVEMVWKP